jgi:hypothetical protein
MPNYQEGKIYTIRNYTDNSLIYVGSTTEKLARRLAKHRTNCKDKKKYSLYSHIVDNDWSNWYIELYEYYPCNNKTELEKREGEVIRLIGSINKVIVGRTRKEYYEDNADKLKDKNKKYREKNPEYFKEYNKEYREENADKEKERHKEYRLKNAEYFKEYKKKYYEENAEKYKEKVCCDICGAFTLKYGLKRHQLTPKCTGAVNKII